MTFPCKITLWNILLSSFLHKSILGKVIVSFLFASIAHMLAHCIVCTVFTMTYKRSKWELWREVWITTWQKRKLSSQRGSGSDEGCLGLCPHSPLRVTVAEHEGLMEPVRESCSGLELNKGESKTLHAADRHGQENSWPVNKLSESYSTFFLLSHRHTRGAPRVDSDWKLIHQTISDFGH